MNTLTTPSSTPTKLNAHLNPKTKTILILGATSTIAQEAQKLWAAKGYRLVLVGRKAHDLEIIAQDLRVRGAIVLTKTFDLLNINGAKALFAEILAEVSRIDLAFLAHGILGKQLEDENSVEKTVSILNSNMVSHIGLLTELAPIFEKQKTGQIVVITSVAGERGKRSNYIYGAAKAGKIAFLSGLRCRLAPSQIPVTDIRLGFVDTTMTVQFPKGPLWISPQMAARCILKAADQKLDVAYVPFFWFWIMLIIKSIPEQIFKRLQL